jgi:hypothetical protein
MLRWKWAGLLMVAALAVTLSAMTSTAGVSGVTPVTDDEGIQVQGGQGTSGCAWYKNTIVNCGTNVCGGQTYACLPLNKLSQPGNDLYVKNVGQYNNGSCWVCSGYCTNGTLSYSAWNPCGP